MMAWRWQDKAMKGDILDDVHLVRRVHGPNEVRFDGIGDLLMRAHGCSVFDTGCNCGHVGWDFAVNGAAVVHGCDISRINIQIARGWFAEHPHVESKFEVVDLTGGKAALTEAFGDTRYDIMLYLGTLHKLQRDMKPDALSALTKHLADRAKTYFVWSGYAEDLTGVDRVVSGEFVKVQWSEMAMAGRPAVIWKRKT